MRAQGLGRARRVRSRSNAAARSTSSASTRNSCSARSRRCSSLATTSTCCTAAPARTTGRWSTSATTTRGLIPVGYVPLHRSRTRAAHATEEAIEMGCGAILRAVGAAARQVADASRLLADLGAPRRDGRAVHAAHRRRRPAAAPRVPRERQAAGHRLPRRRREHPLQGLHGAAPPARDLPRVHGARRRLRTVPRACAAAASNRARCGSSRCCNGSTSRKSTFQTHRARAAAAAQGERLPAAPGEVHAVPDRAGRLDDRTGRARAVLLLVRLPAPRRRPRSARTVRSEPRRASTSRPRPASTPTTTPR